MTFGDNRNVVLGAFVSTNGQQLSTAKVCAAVRTALNFNA
jgi:hypothetical protein